MESTTIKLSKKTRDELAKLKVHEREPFDDVVKRLLEERVKRLQRRSLAR